jgi:transposase
MYLCGIDVSKRKHTALLMDSSGQVIQRAFNFNNDRNGFELLLATLASQPEPVQVGLEATGHYWLSLYEALTRHDYTVMVFNPLQVHAYQRTGLRKVKTDAVDAFWIADFTRICQREPAQEHTEITLQLRELSRFRYRLTEQIGECKQKMLNILERVFPEYESLFSDIFIRSSRELLQQAVVPQELADFDLQELTDLLQRTSRGRFGLTKAESLQTAARQSIGVSFLADAVRVEMRCLLAQIELLETQRLEVDQALAILVAKLPQHLTSIVGVGPVIAATLLAEIGDVHRFDSIEKLVAYAGINATQHQSGQFTATETHMSKRGSPYLRQAVWQAALVASQHDPDLHAYLQRRVAEGKPRGVVLGAICRKMLARIYVVLRDNRPYEVRQLPP